MNNVTRITIAVGLIASLESCTTAKPGGFGEAIDLCYANLGTSYGSYRAPRILGQMRSDVDTLSEVTLPGHAGRLSPKDEVRYVALKALTVELGNEYNPTSTDKQISARYPPAARSKWPRDARRLWLEAFYDLDASSLKNASAETNQLRREGANVEAMDAALMVRGKVTLHTAYEISEKLLAYSESHPKSIASTMLALVNIDGKTFNDGWDRKPIRMDLVNRVLALRPRTETNVDQLLHLNGIKLRSFDLLQDTVQKAIRRSKERKASSSS